ncbi:autotransporter outer membrane beta-barrel domain-containing protein [Bradyrhizobium sp. HKCCYLS20291]|uniref:autotransporter outer membrane beta-barrel domain-containing protein n=1 Tax=Bradyrhizobium sp. HKCCYLS20291 TaxID=3420766 RepID=UPI003EB9201F
MPAPSTRRALLASTAVTTLALSAATPATAQVANWLATPVSSDFNTAANWDTGTVPTQGAVFSSSTITNVSISANTTIGGIVLDPTSPNYVFNVNGARLTFSDFGFVSQSGATASFFVNGAGAGLTFLGASNPGLASYTLGSQTVVDFRDFSSPGAAAFYSAADAIMNFRDSSSAQSASIGGGVVHFYDNSTAGQATMGITTQLTFHGTTTADHAAIGNGGLMEFRDSATAASASIINTQQLSFLNDSTAANANITNSSGAQWIRFQDNATAANATILNQDELEFYGHSTAGHASITNQFILTFNDTSTAASATIINSGDQTFNGSSTAATASITNNRNLYFRDTATADHATLANTVTLGFYGSSSAASSTITNDGQASFNDASTAANAAITNGRLATLTFGQDSSAGQAAVTNTFEATTIFTGSSSAANAVITNDAGGILRFLQGATAGNATLGNSGTLLFEGNATAGSAAIVNNAGGIVDFSASTGPAGDRHLSAGSIAGAGNYILGANQLTVGGNGASTEVSGVISGAGGSLTKTGSGTLTLTGVNSYTGGTTIAAGTLQLGNGGSSGSLVGNIANDATLVFNRTDALAFGGVISGGGTLAKTGTGTLTLSGANTYTGGTTVDGGRLAVDGAITGSSGVSVNAGGTLGGTGQLPSVLINAGGTLAPGNSIGTLTVNGNLNFAPGSFYTVEVSPSAADRTIVTGTADLSNATVNVVALPGSFTARSYTILSAAGGLGGTTFAGFALGSSSFSPARNPHLSYVGNDVQLVLNPAALTLAPGATANERGIANAINRAVDNGATPPAGFDTLLNISDAAAAARALDQLSGESSTQAQSGAFLLGSSYLNLLTAPRDDRRGKAAAALDYAATSDGASERTASTAIRSAFAALDPHTAPRWSAWGAAFGGSNTISGQATSGTHAATINGGATAAGVDYRFAPGSAAGFSMAGGRALWSAGNGSGAADVLMAGVYGRHTAGPSYIAAAAAYANHWMSTTHNVTVAGLDRLAAQFDAQSFGARIEAGTRLAAPFLGLSWTPYGAVQTQHFRAPGYTETAASGSDQFALRFAGRSADAFRAELGVQSERRVAPDWAGELNLFSRTAYAYDAVRHPAAAVSFTALGPSSAFTILGAQPSQHVLLSSAGAEWRLGSELAVMVQAETEWGERSRSYGGRARLRYTW